MPWDTEVIEFLAVQYGQSIIEIKNQMENNLFEMCNTRQQLEETCVPRKTRCLLIYITEEEREKRRRVIDAFVELNEIEDEDILMVDAGSYGFVKLQCYTP